MGKYFSIAFKNASMADKGQTEKNKQCLGQVCTNLY